jgi:hypothetical protein
MPTEPERVFSGTQRTVSSERTRLGSQIVEYSECLKSWISIPEGKDRPLLAGVFQLAEEIDKACNILLGDSTVVDEAKRLGEAALATTM